MSDKTTVNFWPKVSQPILSATCTELMLVFFCIFCNLAAILRDRYCQACLLTNRIVVFFEQQCIMNKRLDNCDIQKSLFQIAWSDLIFSQ